jgi:hypothetical protein
MAWDSTKIDNDKTNPLTATGDWNPMVTYVKSLASKTQYQYIYIPAKDWTIYTPLSMGGTGAEFLTEKLSNGPERTYLGFGDASAQYAYISLKMPVDWDGGNLTLAMDWESTTATAAAIKLDVTGDRLADGGTPNVALTTALVSITDTNTGANKENQSAETAAFTIGGTGYKVRLRISRDITDAFTGDLKVLGLMLKCIVVKA